jgi:hypothetical protein
VAIKPHPYMPHSQTATTSPSSELSSADPGDMILERFRFQITYSGVLAILMADESSGIEELYSELHEDILIKYKNGKFNGIQVKTKDINLPPFNIEQEAIIKSCIKFSKLENKFPGQFNAFAIVSNTGFDKSKSAVCLHTIIEECKSGEIHKKKKSKFWTFIKLLVNESEATEDQVLSMLTKLRISTYSKLEDIHSKLITQLKLCSLLKGLQESKIEEIAELLIAKQFKAASLANNEVSTADFVMGTQSEDDEIKNIIGGKRVSRSGVIDWLNSQKILPVALLLKDRSKIQNIPKGHRKLEVKMDAGGIDSDNIDLMRNFKFAFENHAISWIYKDGIDKAENQYNQISFIAQNACKEIYDEKKVDELENGQEMLVEVRSIIKARKLAEPFLFFDCTYEHLLGAVGVLTESCKVWWSKKFVIDEP